MAALDSTRIMVAPEPLESATKISMQPVPTVPTNNDDDDEVLEPWYRVSDGTTGWNNWCGLCWADSTIHGVKRVFEDAHWTRRMFWILCSIGGIV